MIDLTQIPDDDLGREWARRLTLRRAQSPNKQGRRKVFHSCPYCRVPFGTLDLRKHKPHCSENPRNVIN